MKKDIEESCKGKKKTQTQIEELEAIEESLRQIEQI